MKHTKGILMSLVLMPMMALAGSDLYMVVDLSGGTNATSYGISYLSDVPEGGWTDEYKTTKLVLRRIEPGTCVVTTDEPYYIGVFEVTQKQYELITGTTPSYFSGNDKRPVEQVSYNMLRGTDKGAQYPDSTDVDDDSVMGKLRSRTAIRFDLPTEAQWEYACRAGTTTTYSYGDNADGNYMWYSDNSGSSTHDVGTRIANPLGLFDMHGNVCEWCLDFSSEIGYEDCRVLRSGAWWFQADSSTTSHFFSSHAIGFCNRDGFRLVANIDSTLSDGLIAWYKFDGALNDASGNGYDQHVNGTTSYTEDRHGNNAAAFMLDGNTFLYESSTLERDAWGTNFTFACWFKATEETQLYDVTSSGIKGTSTSTKYLFGDCRFPIAIGTNGINAFEHGSYFLPAVFKYQENIGTAWHYLAMVVTDNMDAVVYLDGKAIGSFSKKSSFTAEFCLGFCDSTSSCKPQGLGTFCYGGRFKGGIDDARFYNRALSATEVNALYNDNQPRIFYVNGSTGSDENSGLSADVAKATIQAAIDVSNDGDTILVAAGTYAPITTENKRIVIVGKRAENTIIEGNITSRGVTVSEDAILEVSTNTLIKGFSIINGNINGSGGAAFGGTFVDCIISNNVAKGAAGGVDSAILINCLIKGNRAINGGGVSGSVAINCTFVNNQASGSGDGSYNSSLVNCVLYGGTHYECYDWNVSAVCKVFGRRIEHIYENDPQFIDAANGNYRLAADSPCIDAGDNSYVVGETDLDGNARIVNGCVDIGCYEYAAKGPVVEGLVAWYKFDGDAKDSTTNGHDGVVHGATLTTDKNGDANGAYHFNGSSWIAVDNSEALTAIHNQITVSAWIKRSASGGNLAPILCKGTDYRNRQYGLNIDAHYTQTTLDEVLYTINDGANYGSSYGNVLVRSQTLLPFDVWQQITMTYDGSVVIAYLNGSELGRESVDGYFPQVSGGLLIGKDPPGATEYLTGDLDDIRIYNRPLSAAEVASLYDSEKPVVKIWTVVFDACGGLASTNTMSVTNGMAIGELPTAERSEHKFLGWFTEKNEGTQVTSETIITNNVTFYAHWFDTSIGNVTGATNVLWRTGGDAVWATEESEDGWSVRSGKIGKNSETWIECVVTNGCRVTFDWKASCEPDDEGEMYDYLSFAIDGEDVAAICGETDWTNCVFTVAGEGEHTLRWTYQKDYRTSEGEDCGWLGRVKVDPEVSVTFDGNGATSGEVPTMATAYWGDEVTIPGCGTLMKSCHTFGGWQLGDTIYSEGEALKVETNVVAFVAVWNAKMLAQVTLATPETPHVTTEKIGISFNMPENATTIRYTLDGSEPTINSPIYEGAFEVGSKSVTVKAIAYAEDWFNSACATWNLTRAPWSAAECLNVETRSFTFGGNADWVRDLDVTHDGEAAMRSGAIGDKQKSLISMSVKGTGSVSFWCKVSSECDPDDGTVYDGLAILVDGEEVFDDLIGGEVDWTNITVVVTGEGDHTIGWRYEKDKTGSAGEDCAWLDEVLWQVDETIVTAVETGSKDVVIGRDWIEKDLVNRYGAGKTDEFRAQFGSDFDLAVRKPNGKTVDGTDGVVWQDYVAGTDPTDTNSVFSSSIQMVDGLPVITWTPDLNEGGAKDEREYKIWGSTNLENGGEWQCPTNATHRFFKVTVEMK